MARCVTGRRSGSWSGLDPGRGMRRCSRSPPSLLLSPSSAWAAAEPHRVEVVGAYPIREALRGKLNPREEAIRKALWEGVSRVALELIGRGGRARRVGGVAADGTASRRARTARRPRAPADSTDRFRKIFGRRSCPIPGASGSSRTAASAPCSSPTSRGFAPSTWSWSRSSSTWSGSRPSSPGRGSSRGRARRRRAAARHARADRARAPCGASAGDRDAPAARGRPASRPSSSRPRASSCASRRRSAPRSSRHDSAASSRPS